MTKEEKKMYRGLAGTFFVPSLLVYFIVTGMDENFLRSVGFEYF